MSESKSAGNSETINTRNGPFNFWRFFWLTFLVVSLAYAWYSFYVPENDIEWSEDLSAAQEEAANSGKLVIVYFTGEWCVPCRIMKREVWADKEVEASVNSEFIPVAVDVGHIDNKDILSRYQVSGAPVTIITDPQGNALRWRAGGISKNEFLQLLAEPETP